MYNSKHVWSLINKYSGEEFYQIRGGVFAYEVRGNCVVPDRTNVQISKASFEETIKLMPLPNTVPLQHLRGPSYTYAILMDGRIFGELNRNVH